MFRRPLLMILTLAACKGKPADACPPGQVDIGSACAVICQNDGDCPSDQRCGDEGHCIPGDVRTCTTPATCSAGETCDRSGICVLISDLPRIDRVIGDRGDGTVDAAMRVEGARLLGASATLEQGNQVQPLSVCAGSNDTAMILDLPDSLVPGDYALAVTNQAGTCAQTVQLLQGSPDTAAQVVAKIDQARAASATNIPIGVVAGGLVATLQAQADGGGVVRSIRVTGAEQVNSASNGLFVVVIDRITHAVQTGTINGAPVGVNYSSVPTDINGLAGLLGSLGANFLVILASKGDITTMSASVSLSNAVQRLGGSATFSALTASQRYVVIGIPGSGAGRGLEMVSDTSTVPAAVSTVLIDASAMGLAGLLQP